MSTNKAHHFYFFFLLSPVFRPAAAAAAAAYYYYTFTLQTWRHCCRLLWCGLPQFLLRTQSTMNDKRMKVEDKTTDRITTAARARRKRRKRFKNLIKKCKASLTHNDKTTYRKKTWRENVGKIGNKGNTTERRNKALYEVQHLKSERQTFKVLSGGDWGNFKIKKINKMLLSLLALRASKAVKSTYFFSALACFNFCYEIMLVLKVH